MVRKNQEKTQLSRKDALPPDLSEWLCEGGGVRDEEQHEEAEMQSLGSSSYVTKIK